MADFSIHHAASADGRRPVRREPAETVLSEITVKPSLNNLIFTAVVTLLPE